MSNPLDHCGKSPALCYVALVAVTLQMILPSSAEAARADFTCEIRFRDSTPSADEDGGVLSRHLAAEIRHNRTGEILRYSAVRQVLKVNYDVCLFEIERPIDEPQVSGGLPVVLETRTFMLKGEGECPRQDDDRYVQVSGVSEGLFVEFIKFVEALSLDEETFENSVRMSVSERAEPGTDFDRFRNGMLESNPMARPVLRGIVLPDWYDQPGASGYELVFRTRDEGYAWVISADVTAEGLKIFGCSQIRI